MKGRWLWTVIVANLIGLLALAFVYPHLMVSPGALEPAHAMLATDCFACHVPLRGASSERCIACHALPDIGVRTTKGVLVAAASTAGKNRRKLSFHQELTEENCIACHSDHAGPKLTQGGRIRFSHALLRTQVRDRCESCHAPPNNEMHRTLKVSCAQCHTTNAWSPASFNHNKYFVLSGSHNAACATCHDGNDYRKYTCYGCHEHTPDNVRRIHDEEGGRNLDQCAQCHRGSGGESEREGERRGGGGEGRGREERD